MAAMGVLTIGAGAADSPAQASIPARERLGWIQKYEIPPGSMATALNTFAYVSGLHIAYDARVTERLTTSGLDGAFSTKDGLDRLLRGSGLAYRFADNGRSVSIVLAQNDTGVRTDASGATALPTIDVGREARSERGAAGVRGPGDRATGYSAPSATSALKTDTPILQTPVAVQVVTRQTMDDQQAISIQEALTTNASSVSQNPSASTYDSFNIRGFSTNYGVYRNNLRRHLVSTLDTSNLQSVEILKGPAGMLYGRVEPGGIIDLVVKRPLETPYYSFQEQAGSFGMTRTSVDATGPLTPDRTWLYRISGNFMHADSYIDYANSQNVFIAPTITFHPDEQFRLNVDAEFQDSILVDVYQTIPAIGTRPASVPISRYLQDPAVTANNPTRHTRELIGYDWTFAFDKDWSLTNRLLYEYGYHGVTTTYFGSINEATGDATRRLFMTPTYVGSLSTNLDLKGKFETGPLRHDLLVGGDFFTENQDQYNGYLGVSPYVKSINIYAPVYGSGVPYKPTPNAFTYARENWKGLYLQDMISAFDDRAHLLLGGRYDWADAVNSFSSVSYVSAKNAAVTIYNEAFSPRIGLSIQPFPWLSFYGNYSQSFGANNGVTGGNIPLAPQRARQWEGGVKAEFFDKRLTATFAYYDITKTNIPTPDPLNPRFSTLIGEAESEGVEFDLTGRLDDNWSVIGNFSHDYAVVTKDNNKANIGRRLPSAPLNAGNLWLKYDAHGAFEGLSLGGGVSIVGSMQGDTANDFQLPDYTLVNAMASYRFEVEGAAVTAQLNVKNLTDAIYYPASLNRTTITVGAPRTVLGSIRVEF